MSNLVEGLWDCKYCGAKGIGGLTKHCPSCGHPQDEDTKFYLGEVKKHLDDATAENYGKGSDWLCSYCDSLNRFDAEVCSNCGAAREENRGDYFTKDEKPAEEPEAAPVKKRSPLKLLAIIAAVIVAFAAIIGFATRSKDTSSQVEGKSWSRSIAVETLQTVKESGWSVPEGGETYSTAQEVHHFDQVLDHYETVEVKKSREVLDHYDEDTEYEDNGDGTFSEITVTTPVYRTEYYYETEQQPVYTNVPVMATKYYYTIDRWVETRTVETSGEDNTPAWGKTALRSEGEREGAKTEEYVLNLTTDKGKTYEVKVTEDFWNSLHEGDSIDITVKSGKVTMLNGDASAIVQ